MTRRAFGLFLLAFALALGACKTETVPDFYGVRLGMTASDVRDRFTATGGTYKADVAADDYSIRWSPGADPKARARGGGDPNPLEVDFAFHMGTLVAIVARVPAGASFAAGPTYVVTKSSVLKRSSVAGGADLTIDLLARDCPTHKARAEALVAEAGVDAQNAK